MTLKTLLGLIILDQYCQDTEGIVKLDSSFCEKVHTSMMQYSTVLYDLVSLLKFSLCSTLFPAWVQQNP